MSDEKKLNTRWSIWRRTELIKQWELRQILYIR